MNVARFEAPQQTAARPSAPESTGSALRWRDVARTACAVVALLALGFVGFVSVFSGLIHGRAQVGLERRFAAELAVGAAPVNQPIPTGSPVALLEVPAVGIREIVVEGSRPEQLTKGPGHVSVSVLPGQKGVSVVMGRRLGFGGPFGRLADVEPGDEITTTTGQGAIRYRVTRERRVSATDGNALTADGNALLLVTSDPVGRAQRRLVVEARPTGQVAPAGRTAGAEVTDADLGLVGDTGALPSLLVAVELLAGAVAAVYFGARRVGNAIAWVLGVPLVAAASWLVFEQAALLLPATL